MWLRRKEEEEEIHISYNKQQQQHITHVYIICDRDTVVYIIYCTAVRSPLPLPLSPSRPP